MPRVEEASVIDRRPEDVFAFVTTPEHDLRRFSASGSQPHRVSAAPTSDG